MKLPTIFHNIEDRSRLRSQKKAERMMILMGAEAMVMVNRAAGGP